MPRSATMPQSGGETTPLLCVFELYLGFVRRCTVLLFEFFDKIGAIAKAALVRYRLNVHALGEHDFCFF